MLRRLLFGKELLKEVLQIFFSFFLPTGDFKMGIIDFVIKIIGGAVTFGLIAIALRRRFEDIDINHITRKR
jgi:hypothetical protein